MYDRDMVDDSEIPLRVFENETQDKGRNIVRIDPEIMHTLNIVEGDLVSVIGPQNETNIICLTLDPTDTSNDREIIRIDSNTRDLIGAVLGDTVTIKKAILSEKNNKYTRIDSLEISDDITNSIIITGSCPNFEIERPKIMEFLKSLEKEVHLNHNYCKCYVNGKKTLGWDFFDIAVDLRLVQRLIEIHPEIDKQEAASLEERFALWLHAKIKKTKLDYHLKVREIPYEAVKGFRLNPNDFRNKEDMENLR
jgi:Cell division protein 48 (CDC48), N-terminal domain